MRPRPIRVLIADDHPTMRDGIAAALISQGGIEIVGRACNGEDAIGHFARSRPDVSIIDLQMPVKDGLEAILGIRALHRDARIIVLTTYSGDARIRATLNAGALSYLLKNVRGAELADAIRRAYHGVSVLAPLARREMDSYYPPDRLSARELDVLQLAADGCSNRVIGEILHISEPTVKTHMSTILAKLCARDRTHAVTLAITRGYISV